MHDIILYAYFNNSNENFIHSDRRAKKKKAVAGTATSESIGNCSNEHD